MSLKLSESLDECNLYFRVSSLYLASSDLNAASKKVYCYLCFIRQGQINAGLRPEIDINPIEDHAKRLAMPPEQFKSAVFDLLQPINTKLYTAGKKRDIELIPLFLMPGKVNVCWTQLGSPQPTMIPGRALALPTELLPMYCALSQLVKKDNQLVSIESIEDKSGHEFSLDHLSSLQQLKHIELTHDDENAERYKISLLNR